jgi:hypothetical protein
VVEVYREVEFLVCEGYNKFSLVKYLTSMGFYIHIGIIRRSKLKEVYKAKLQVNKKPIELNPFVEEFLAQISIGAVTSLKGVDYIRSVKIHQEHDDVNITVNGEEIPLTPFPVMIIANTLRGLASTLKGVDDIKSLDVSLEH